MKFLSESLSVLFKTLTGKNLVFGYIVGIITYNIVAAYIDGKDGLAIYKILKNSDQKSSYSLDSFEYYLNNCKNKWSAIKFASLYNLNDNFFNSIIWPLKIVSNIIPFLVLYFEKDSK